MNNVFLIQSVDSDTFRKLAKEGVKVKDLDCCALVSTSYVCMSYQAAVENCRDLNRHQAYLRFFVSVVPCL